MDQFGMVDWICRDQNLRSLGEETVSEQAALFWLSCPCQRLRFPHYMLLLLSNFTLHESISLCSSWSCTWYFSFSDDMEDTRYLSIPVSWTRDVCHSLCHGQHEMLPSLCHWHDKVGTFIRLVGNPRAIRSGLGRVAILCHVNRFMLYVFIKINAEHRPIERDLH